MVQTPGMSNDATALIYTAPHRAELHKVPLPEMAADWVEVRTVATALSRGTERLVWSGQVPVSEHERMRAPFQSGDFPFPVRYGYCAVGLVEDGPAALLGRHVFCLHPHQDRFRVPAEAVVPLPRNLPPGRAILAANAETAVNAIWDATLPPGSRVLVVGLGLLGCLIAAFLSKRENLAVYCTDLISQRSAILADFKVSFVTTTEQCPPCVTAFHTSASSAGLKGAINALEFEGEVVELSWFGGNPVTLDLGGSFHSQRLTIRSSQVGHVARSRRASTSYRERMEIALNALADPRIDAFVTGEVAFQDLPDALPGLLGPGAEGIATRITY